MDKHRRSRVEDAALFEDWSEWERLGGSYVQFRQTQYGPMPTPSRLTQWPTYYCVLVTDSPIAPGEPGFEIKIPTSVTILDFVRRLPGVRQHPRGRVDNYNSWDRDFRWLAYTFFVPAQHWAQLRRGLPKLKRLVLSWTGEQ